MIKLLKRLQPCKHYPSPATPPIDTTMDKTTEPAIDSKTIIPAVSTTKHGKSTNPIAPPSPPQSPLFPLPSAEALSPANAKPSPAPPRFPPDPCPTAHHTLSLLSSEHTAQRLFGPSFTLRCPSTGALLGPFALLSYTDAWIPAYCRYIHNTLATPLFTLRERDIIVLAAAGVTQAHFLVQSYRKNAGEAGFCKETIECVLSREAWQRIPGLSARERNVYRLASEMAGSWGRVGEETWRAVVVRDEPKRRGQEGWLEPEPEPEPEPKLYEQEGKEGGQRERLTKKEVATLAQVLASALFMSVLVNCAEAAVP